MAKFRVRTGRLNHEQRDRLVELVESMPLLHTARFTGVEGKRQVEKMWSQVARELNILGPGKTWKQWKQVWRDINGAVRSRNSGIAITPGSLSAPKPLTEFELRVLRAIGVARSEGKAGLNEIGYEEPEASPARSPASSPGPFGHGQSPVYFPSSLEKCLTDPLSAEIMNTSASSPPAENRIRRASSLLSTSTPSPPDSPIIAKDDEPWEPNQKTRRAYRRQPPTIQKSSFQRVPQALDSGSESIAEGLTLLSESIRYLADTLAASAGSIATAIISSRHPSPEADYSTDTL